MMRALVIASCLLLPRPAPADVSPRLRLVARGGLAMRSLGDDTRVLVTARITGGAPALRALGLSARALSDDVAALRVTRSELQWLETRRDIRVEERRLFRPVLDRAATFMGATAARAATGLSGKGTLVGVVDTGADFRHLDLRNANGTTRLEALLDLRIADDGRHAQLGAFGGTVFDRSQIDQQLVADAQGTTPKVVVSEFDDDGHGTHVSSIAAGNGNATGNGLPAGRYVGIAPGADLLVVQSRDENGNLSDAGILSGCNFLVAEQAALGRPLVVNLSLGGRGGPHDGSTNTELALDQLFPRDRPGRALVVAAGNDGANDLHAGGWALDGEVTVPFDPAGTTGPALELWYRGAIDVALETPDHHRSAWVAPGRSLDATHEGTRILVDNASHGPSSSGQSDAIVALTLDATAEKTGTYALHLRGHAMRFDAWMLEEGARFLGALDEGTRLSTPATARAAIAIGAVISRLDWPFVEGTTFALPGIDPTLVGGPASFSSTGPTADDRFAPDVAAPGEFVIAAMSRDAPYTLASSSFHLVDQRFPADLLVAYDGVHGVLRGTSQAAPMVTGAIALLLEADPTLTSDQLRELLRTSAASVGGTAGWSPRVGFGSVDVRAALALLHGDHGQVVSPTASRVGLSRDLLPPDSEETTVVSVTPRDDTGRPVGPGHVVTIELFGSSSARTGEPLGPVRDIGAGRYERTFVAHAQRGTSAVVHTIVDGTTLVEQPTLWFVRSRVEIGGHLQGAGGCEIGGGNDGSFLAMLLFALQQATRRRVRRS